MRRLANSRKPDHLFAHVSAVGGDEPESVCSGQFGVNAPLDHRESITNALDANRSGVTLVEVLMALMIMSIGVSSVAVLFPISVLRSIQATQMTNGAIVKYNVETLVDIHPELIFDPDRDGDLDEHFRQRINRNYVVDPVGFYTHFFDGNNGTAGQPNYAGVFGNDGLGNTFGVRRWGGGLLATDGQGPAASLAHARAIRLKALSFANQGDGWDTQIDAEPIGVQIHPNRPALPSSPPIVGVWLNKSLDLTQVPTSQLLVPPNGSGGYLIEDPELYRIVLVSGDGRTSQAFPLTAIDTTSNPNHHIAYFTEDLNLNGNALPDSGEDFNMNGATDFRPLPNEFGGDVSRVILQSRKVSDYTWMLNVRRRSDGLARRVDVVVRFNDGVTAEDEQVYEATFVEGTSLVGVRYASGNEPNIRKGKFVFDAVNGIWYRIEDVQERSLIGWQWPTYDAVVRVQKQISEPAGEDQFDKFDSGGVSLLLNGQLDPDEYDYDSSGSLVQVSGPEARTPPGNGDSTLDFGYAMFPNGVVDVYPMGSRNVPESMTARRF